MVESGLLNFQKTGSDRTRVLAAARKCMKMGSIEMQYISGMIFAFKEI